MPVNVCRPLCLLAFLLWVGAATPTFGRDWKSFRLTIVPGEKVGSITLGQPLPEATRKYMGLTAEELPPEEAVDSGVVMWGKLGSKNFQQGLLIRLNDGQARDNVSSISVRDIRAATEKGLYLGAPVSLIAEKYPEAQNDGDRWHIPGLVIWVEGGKIAQFDIEPRARRRWRFAELVVWPARRAGPLELGEPLTKEALELLGPPQLDSDHLVRWFNQGQVRREISVELSAGKIKSVKLIRVAAMTDRKLRLGVTAPMVKQIYPDGRQGLSTEFDTEFWKLPGLKLTLYRDRLTEFLVYQNKTVF